MHATNPSPLMSTDAHFIYPQKLPSTSIIKESTLLETPQDDGTATEGLAIRDMIVSGYDQNANTAIWQVLLAAGVGFGLGLLLTHVKISNDAAEWVALPGDLFIAALNCLIVPMVFCSVVVCIGELMEAGKAASIGGRTISYFVASSITASTVGVVTGYFFSNAFNLKVQAATGSKIPKLSMVCNSGGFLTMQSSGIVSCAEQNSTEGLSLFTLNDTTSYFTTSTSTGYANLSVSEQVFGILRSLVPDNIVNSFATSSTLSVITFAVCFGIALVRSVDKSKEGDNYPLLLIAHANVIFRMLINKVVAVIPVAIVSMIAGSLAQSSTSKDLLESVGFLIVALFIALFLLTVVILGTALFITTRRNIFSWLRHIVPAQVFIFGCSSSIATLPITLRCVETSREVSSALARFVLPLGATSNLNGTAVYMPLACIYMASVSGNEDDLTPLTYVMLAFVGAIASFGVAPVPHSGLVMVLTVWRTVFNKDVPPQAFSILVGTDWILNRMRAVVNITNDTIVCRIIAHQCDETVEAQLNQHQGEQPDTPGTPVTPVTSL